MRAGQKLEEGEIKELQASKEKRQVLNRCINSTYGTKITLKMAKNRAHTARETCGLPSCQHGFEDGRYIIKFEPGIVREARENCNTGESPLSNTDSRY